MKYFFKFKLRTTIPFEWYKKCRQKWLVKKSKFVWRKKNPPEHKYSVTFVSKVGTIKEKRSLNNYLIEKIWWKKTPRFSKLCNDFPLKLAQFLNSSDNFWIFIVFNRVFFLRYFKIPFCIYQQQLNICFLILIWELSVPFINLNDKNRIKIAIKTVIKTAWCVTICCL